MRTMRFLDISTLLAVDGGGKSAIEIGRGIIVDVENSVVDDMVGTAPLVIDLYSPRPCKTRPACTLAASAVFFNATAGRSAPFQPESEDKLEEDVDRVAYTLTLLLRCSAENRSGQERTSPSCGTASHKASSSCCARSSSVFDSMRVRGRTGEKSCSDAKLDLPFGVFSGLWLLDKLRC